MRRRRRPRSRKGRKARNKSREGRREVKILVGLGNPGEDYMTTRHNIGTRVAEEILQRRGAPHEGRKTRSKIGRAGIRGQRANVAPPPTLRRRSGGGGRACLQFG